MKYAKARDLNESIIVLALETVGCAVQRVNEAGAPDLIVSYHDVMTWLEVKNPATKQRQRQDVDDIGGGHLTPTQSKWWKHWKGKRPVIVRTVDDALRAVGVRT